MQITDNNWTLFLDRDGVINVRLIDDYIKKVSEFEFIDGVLDAIKIFDKLFNRMFIVSNQQGVGKGVMSQSNLDEVTMHMLSAISKEEIYFDKVYYCTTLSSEKSEFRKPKPGMGFQAQADFPDVDLTKAIMVGDSISDMEFGRNLGVYNIFISNDTSKIEANKTLIDEHFPSLYAYAKDLEAKANL